MMTNLHFGGSWNDDEDFESHLPFQGRFIGALEDGDHFELIARVIGVIRNDNSTLKIGFKIVIQEPTEIAGRRGIVWFKEGGNGAGLIQIHDE